MEEIFLSKFDNIDENEIIKNVETPKVEEKIDKPIEKEIKQKTVKKQPAKNPYEIIKKV